MPVWIAILSISLEVFMKMGYMFDILLSGRILWNTYITAHSHQILESTNVKKKINKKDLE